MAPSRYRRSLTQGLDKEVHQIVLKMIGERTQYGDNDFRLSFPAVYDEIKRSNSSLNRKPKKLLEDAIERVIETIRQDVAESDSEDALEIPELQPRPNGLNRSIVAAWSRGTSTPTKEDTTEPAATKPDQTNGEPPRKKRKRVPAIDRSPPTHVSLRDLGGVDSVVKQFFDLLYIPLLYPEAYADSNMQPIRGILIHGPPGCGKTTVANAIAAQFGTNFISVSAPSVVSGMSGESEKALREHFDEAKKAAPCLLFLDEIDAITPKRENSQREMEKRIVAQLGTCMDDLDLAKTDGKPVIVLAATNRPDSLDPALRRGGRFDKEINMNVPNEPMRQSILKALTRKSPLAPDVDLLTLAKRTPGFVGADLRDLVLTASNAAMRRFQDAIHSAAASEPLPSTEIMDLDNTTSLPNATPTDSPVLDYVERMITYGRTHRNPSSSQPILLTQSDFLSSLPKINPSALREGFATVPTTTFANIGALTPLIHELSTTIIDPILRPDIFASLGITPTSGALLFGPPGCGKTLLAKACANSSSANFISVKGPELLNKYVGESERAVRQVFHRARSSVPVIIFFDELDALVPRRDSASNDASARVVNTLLSELDGVGQSREGVYVVAATNRPDIIDPAMLRPGRLETLLYVGLPDADGRVEILRTLCKSIPHFEFSPRIDEIARECEGFSGADLESLKRRAGYAAVSRYTKSAGGGVSAPIAGGDVDDSEGVVANPARTPAAGNTAEALRTQVAIATDVNYQPFTVLAEDFETAKAYVKRSVSEGDVKYYERLRREWEKS